MEFLYDRINYEKLANSGGKYPFRLRRMVELLVRLDLTRLVHPSHLEGLAKVPATPENTPQQTVPIVHIAGTKGKGSTATMVASVLTAAGIKTGAYTSPHLHRLEERFRVDGLLCEPAELVGLVDRVRSVANEMAKDDAGEPTFFELTTAIALLHFHLSKCQAIVLEVGLGGRLDSTNVCLSTVSVITSIGLDHQHVLGDTKELIAAEKAGIIKSGVPVVCGVTETGPQAVIEEIALANNATLYQIDQDFSVQSQPNQDWGSQISFDANNSALQSIADINLSLEGIHQTRNASLAIAAIQILMQQTTHSVENDAYRLALANVTCEGRIERYRLPGDVTVLIDAAHNDDSIAALCDAINVRGGSASQPMTFIFGTSIDKVAEPMIRRITKLADTLVLTQFTSNPRFTDPESLRNYIPTSWQGTLMVEPDPLTACRIAVEKATPGSTIVLCGSFFLAAETRQWFAAQKL
ncbi:Folylpolyglutamate synthase [Rubripirellula obstinata]|uniref:Dihydrofolate synthase/folylpolyglutamate synthase n=2 Tax=Rubripirellula obstinata TaxID=406547 RepID=A0A5B1CKE0_9BACT|nr:Folylpolyglutamate synthase [Rubripirellula obstinata]